MQIFLVYVAFAVEILNLVKYLKEQRETIISNQIGRAGTSIGANIHEAQYAHGKADFVSKLQIALKCSSESSLHRPSLFNCKESRHLTFSTKNKKAAYLNFIHL